MEKNGLAEWNLRHMANDDIKQLKETVQFMLKHFIDLEQYEKCILLKNELEKIDLIIERV